MVSASIDRSSPNNNCFARGARPARLGRFLLREGRAGLLGALLVLLLAAPWAGAAGNRIAAGENFAFAIKSDGTLWGWGWGNGAGLPGYGGVNASPVQLGTGFESIAAGFGHAAGVKSDGSLWAWGQNGSGQVGNGGTDTVLSPVQIGTGFTLVTAGCSHTVAIKSDGSVWAWGANGSGQLGDGTTTGRSTPVQIGTDFAMVAAGCNYTLGIKTDATLWAWGDNIYGQIGDGTFGAVNARPSPVQIGSGFMWVAAGNRQSVAVKSDGSLWRWGLDNGFMSPVQIGTGFAVAASGTGFEAAIKSDGTLWTRGYGWDGQLGDGNGESTRVDPVQIGTGYAAVALGSNSAVAIKTDGSLWTWGSGGVGQIGDGTTTGKTSPVQIGTGYGLPSSSTTTTTTAAVTTTTTASTTTTSAASTTTTTSSSSTTTLAGAYGAVNLAKDKTVTAVTNTVLGTPQNAVDGDINTPWYSSQGAPSSNAFTLDLGASYSIGRMVVYPSQVHSFTLSTSEDGSTWTERYRSPWTEASVVAPIGLPVNGAYSARYVKFEGSADWNQYVGMIELAVFEWLTSPPAEPAGSYGTANLALNKTAADVAPLTSASGSPPSNAVDGNASTSWVGNSVWVDDMFHKPSGTGLIKIDLGAEYAVGKIMVRPERVHNYTLVLATTDAATGTNTYPSGARWLFRSYPEMFGTANTSSEPHTFDVKGNITARYIWVETHTWETPTEILPAIAEIVVLEWMPAAAGAYGTVNLAKDKTVTPITNTVLGTPQNAVDGDINTPWYSSQGAPSSNAFTLDLGASYSIGRMVVYPSQVHSFVLSTSEDGSTWTERYRSPWTEASVVAPIGLPVNGAYSARYVKFEGSADWNQYVGMIELAVFEWLASAPAAPAGSYGSANLALNKTVADVAPLTSESGSPPSNALDGNATTSWVGNHVWVDDKYQKPSGTGLIKIDLGAEYPIGRITVRPERVHNYTLVLATTDATTGSNTYPSGARWLFRSYPEMFGTATTSNEPHTFDVKGNISARYIWVEAHTWETPTTILPSIAEIEVLEWTSSTTTSTTTTGAGTTTTTTTGSTTTTLAAGGTFDFGGGWNLVGNSASEPIDVATAFGDTGKVTTVWKWVAETAKWAFYAPSLNSQALADYAASKGYDVLSSIAGGEGFWVNAKAAFSAPAASGTPIASTTFQTDAVSGQSKLVKGWNLIAIGDNKTPSQFNSAIGATPPAAGQIPTNLTTLWAWDASLANWYFYAPSLEAKGGSFLVDYIVSKNYLNFGDNTLGPTTGFWVNKP